MAAQVHRRSFCVDEYHRMAEAGIFSHHEHVELITGEIIALVPIGSYHASQVDRFNRFFIKKTNDKAIVRVQNSIYEVYSEPTEHGYAASKKYYQWKTVVSAKFPDISIAVDDIFG